MPHNPLLVSIIIPSYNHGRFLSETIRSALSQRAPNLAVEVLIIDDGSTDDTRAVIAGLRDEDIRVVCQENHGAAFAINRGLSLARGDYIAILNSDDVYHEGRLARLVGALESDRECHLAVSKVRLIDEQGKVVTEGMEFEWLKKAHETYGDNNDFLLSVLLDNFTCTSSNFVFRRSLPDKIGLFKPLRYVHDWDFLLRSLLSCKCIYLDQELLSYRIHGQNTISERNHSNRADFILEMSWVFATLLENARLYQRVDVERLMEVMLKAHRLNLETVLFISFYFKQFDRKESLLEEGGPRAALMRAINEKIEEMEYVKDLEKTRHFFVNVKIPQYEVHIEQLNHDLTRHITHVADLTKRVGQLERENQEIWAARNWFQQQLEYVLQSKRFRLIGHLLEIKSFRNIGYHLTAIIKIMLPTGRKQRLKQIKQRLPGFVAIRQFFLRASRTTRKLLFPLKKYHQIKYNGPLLSIIAPCFNYGRYLDSFVACLQDQTFRNFEVILIDDGSTDPFTIEKIDQLQALALDNFRIIRQQNEGVIDARNKAVEVARGKYIFALDPDDAIDKTFLEKCLLYLESAPPNVFVYSWTYSMGEASFIWQTYDTQSLAVLNENRAGIAVIPREAFIAVGGYNRLMREGYEDWELIVNLVRSGYIGKMIPEPLYHYYVRKGSRNSFARTRHEQLKSLIHELHRQYIISHERLLERIHRQEYVVTNVLINLVKPDNRPDTTYFLVVLDKAKPGTAETLANLLSYADSGNRDFLVIGGPRWRRFFYLNVKPRLFIYHPQHYNYAGNGTVIYDYLRSRYRIRDFAVDAPPETPSPNELSRKINILYIAPWLIPGGADMATMDWFKQLDGELFNKYLVTTEPKENVWMLDLRGFSKEIYELPTLGCNTAKSIKNFVLHLIGLKKINIVHIMNSSAGYDLLPVIKNRFPEVITVTQFHCFDYLENGERAGYSHHVPIRYDAYIDYYNVISRSLKQEMLDLFPWIDDSKFRVIYCCIDTDKFDLGNIQRDPSILSHQQPGKLNILFIGRLDRQKQPLVMARVAQELKEKGVPFVIHVLGEGSLKSQQKELRNYIRDNDLTEYVLLHGAQSQEKILSWYAVGDVLLMTSEWEGIPIVLYEAMSMGLVCVAPNLGGIKELIDDECGFVVDDWRDIEQYVHVLERLYGDRYLRKSMGEKGRKRCVDVFDISRMKHEYEAFYKGIVHQESMSPAESEYAKV
jgi:glycosyltransferase involved in cell wall biosynthesis